MNLKNILIAISMISATNAATDAATNAASVEQLMNQYNEMPAERQRRFWVSLNEKSLPSFGPQKSLESPLGRV